MSQSPPGLSFKEFRQVLAESPSRAAAAVVEVHPADTAQWLQDVPDEDGWQVFCALSTELRAEVLEYADEALRASFVPRLSAHDLTQLAEELPPDRAVDVLSDADDRVTEDVLEAIPIELAKELRELISYPADSAGGVMTSDFVTVHPGMHVGDAIKEIRQEDGSEEDIGVFVIDDDERPVGYLSDRALLSTPIHTPVEEVMADPFTIRASEDQEEAATLLAKYNLSALAVVDEAARLVGVISAEDAAEIYESEVDEDILKLVGTAPGETQQTRLSIPARVRQRMPLMAVTAAGGLLSAWILEVALGVGERGAPEVSDGGSGAAILRYLPLIIGLAGNVGIQSSTILVRGFATGEVEPDREGKVLLSEVGVGATIGLMCGLITFFVASWMEEGIWMHIFGAAVGSAVAVAVLWAALLGCVVPIGCRRMNIDPAIVAGPFLICLSDLSGSAIYILVARALLGG